LKKRAEPTSSEYKNAVRVLNNGPRGVKVTFTGIRDSDLFWHNSKKQSLTLMPKGYSRYKKEIEGTRGKKFFKNRNAAGED
jgi:hypothetical protein